MSETKAYASALDFGAAGDGVTDDAGAIQAALDSGARGVVIPAGAYAIRNVLIPHEGQCLVIDGLVRVEDAEIQPLTADVEAGDRTVAVADASGYAVGEWVTLHDDRLPVQGGGHKDRRQNAGNARIVSIEGRRLMLDRPSARSYRREAHAVLGRQHGAVWIRHSGVRICGTGTIDGNRKRQLDAAPCPMEDEAGEDWRVGSGVAAVGDRTLRHIVVEGITVRDTLLHGIGLKNAEQSVIRNTICLGAHDKNITLWNCRDCGIYGNIASDSGWEDGIMLHQVRDPAQASRRIMIGNNICANNPRYGIHVGANIREIHLSNNLCRENGLNLSLYGDNCTSTGDVAVGVDDRLYMARVYRPNVLLGGRQVGASNLTALGTRYAGVEISGSDVTVMGGRVGDMDLPSPEAPRAPSVRIEEGGWGRGSGEFWVEGEGRIGIALVPGLSGSNAAVHPTSVRICGVRVEGCRVGLKVMDGARRVSLRDNAFDRNEAAAEVADEAWPEVRLRDNDGLSSAGESRDGTGAGSRQSRSEGRQEESDGGR